MTASWLLSALATLAVYVFMAFAQPCENVIQKHERHVRSSDKALLYDRLGITDRSCCVVDHIIPLELGGHNELSNLQVQDKQSAKEKDRVENYLARLVCRGEMPLAEAQQQIQRWRKVKIQ